MGDYILRPPPAGGEYNFPLILSTYIGFDAINTKMVDKYSLYSYSALIINGIGKYHP
jgi:hypothetical protein